VWVHVFRFAEKQIKPQETFNLLGDQKLLGCSNEIHLLINSALATFDVWEKSEKAGGD
jgi:hypothetical protein